MKKYFFIACALLLYIGIFFSSFSCYAARFQKTATYQVCFTPGEDCTKKIVTATSRARSTILVQAYTFTSMKIAKSLVNAKHRHVDVKIILDKSQLNQKTYSVIPFLTQNKIPLWVDYQPAIAHNKVIIIDNKKVITGSFNLTRSAQVRNAENILIIQDTSLAKQYTHNWEKRFSCSQKIDSKTKIKPPSKEKNIWDMLSSFLNKKGRLLQILK